MGVGSRPLGIGAGLGHFRLEDHPLAASAAHQHTQRRGKPEMANTDGEYSLVPQSRVFHRAIAHPRSVSGIRVQHEVTAIALIMVNSRRVFSSGTTTSVHSTGRPRL